MKRSLGQMEVENEQLKSKVEHLNEDIRNLGNVNSTLEKRLEMEKASVRISFSFFFSVLKKSWKCCMSEGIIFVLTHILGIFVCEVDVGFAGGKSGTLSSPTPLPWKKKKKFYDIPV